MGVSPISKRAQYESLSRGDLIDALCTRDSTQSPTLVHELQVHQVELEMQNRQLREMQQQLEESRSRYADLFDLAPVAYCLFDRNGLIEDCNLVAATMLRMNRTALIGNAFTRVVSVAEKQTFADHVARCFDEELRVTTDLTVVIRGRGEVVLQVVSTPVVGNGSYARSCRTMLNDVTRLKRSEGVFRFLASVNEALAGSLETRSTLATLAKVCVPVLADVCFIDLFDGQTVKRAEIATARGVRDADIVLRHHMLDAGWQAYERQMLDTLTPLFEPTSASALGADVSTSLGAKALLLVPLVARGRTLGVLGAVMTSSERTYSLQDFELAQDVARRAAMAIDNALLYDAAHKAIDAREELSRALRDPLNVILGSAAANKDCDDPRMESALKVIGQAAARIDALAKEKLGSSPPDALVVPNVPHEPHVAKSVPPMAPPRPPPIMLVIDRNDASREALRGALQLRGYVVVDGPDAARATIYLRTCADPPTAMIVDADSLDGSHDAIASLRAEAIPVVLTGTRGSPLAELGREIGARTHFEKPVALDALLATLED